MSFPWRLKQHSFLRLDQLNRRASYMALLKECERLYVRLVYKHHTPTGVCAQRVPQHRGIEQAFGALGEVKEKGDE